MTSTAVHILPRSTAAQFRPRVAAWCMALCVAALSLGATLSARADDFINRANAMYAQIAQDRRSDTVLLPVLAKMTRPPESVSRADDAMMLPAGAQGWAEAVAWAQAPEQRAALEALAACTGERDWRRAYAFGQPYGINGVPVSLIQAKLFTDLGDPPTLAGAKLHYMKALEWLWSLVNVEATRLVADGKASDAVDLMINWVFFGRQMADRQMYAESSWGLKMMIAGYERLRDVIYVDSRTGARLEVGRLRDQIARLSESGTFLDLSRMRFPMGNRIAAEQLISRFYASGDQVDQRAFATSMARLRSGERPLRLFSESGHWRMVAGTQGSGSEATQIVAGIFDDWNARWNIASRFDPRMLVLSSYSRLDADRFAAVSVAVPDMSELINLRELASLEAIGSRASMGLMGHFYTTRNFAPQISAIRPAWLPEIESDPFNPTNRNRGGKPPLEYFVPVRDTEALHGAGTPHEIQVFVNGANFRVNLTNDVFVLYSWGSDHAKNNARRVQNVSARVEGADYLLWPPRLSLYRQYRLDLGELN
jgi:hypothetical protein